MSFEKKLKRAIRKNDLLEIEKVFEQIYYKYGKLIGFVISKYVSNNSDVEELVNDVFLNFSKVLFSIKLDNIKYYLVVQAKNTAINFVKKNSKKIIIYNDDFFDQNDETSKESIMYEVLKDMENCLTEYEIKIIVLHSVYCYSFVALSKKYNKPVTTISSTYHRSIKKIKAYYGKKGDVKND